MFKPELDEVGKTLLATAEALEKYGWCQNSLYNNKSGGMCALGAQLYVVAGCIDFSSKTKAQIKLIREMTNRLCSTIGLNNILINIVNWNDDPKRTKEEVIQAHLDAAYLRTTVKVDL